MIPTEASDPLIAKVLKLHERHRKVGYCLIKRLAVASGDGLHAFRLDFASLRQRHITEAGERRLSPRFDERVKAVRLRSRADAADPHRQDDARQGMVSEEPSHRRIDGFLATVRMVDHLSFPAPEIARRRIAKDYARTLSPASAFLLIQRGKSAMFAGLRRGHTTRSLGSSNLTGARARKGRRGSAAASILASLLLAACTTPQGPEPTVQIRTVSVPVAVKCAVDPGPEPNYADSAQAIAAAPNIFELAKLYAEGRAQRIGRLIELQAANAGCR